MPITVSIPTALRKLTNNQPSVTVQAKTVGEVFTGLTKQYPEIKRHLFTEDGKLRNFVRVYVNEEDIQYIAAGKEAPLQEGDTVTIVPSIAGGKELSSTLRRYGIPTVFFLTLSCGVHIFASENTNAVALIMKEAKIEKADQNAMGELEETAKRASLVVEVTVINPRTSVRAADGSQSWVAIEAKPDRIFFGKWEGKSIFVQDMDNGRLSHVDASCFPYNHRFKIGERCILFLAPDRQLSEWCKLEVFERLKVVPVPEPTSINAASEQTVPD